MLLSYEIIYKAQNQYEEGIPGAHWQFLIIPEENETQQEITVKFSNSSNAYYEYSINGYGFRTIRVQSKEDLKHISFEASFSLIKKSINPFSKVSTLSPQEILKRINELSFQVDYEPFLSSTSLTELPSIRKPLFEFSWEKSILINLQDLMKWVYKEIKYTPNVTGVDTVLTEIIEHRQGVCQDFTHLFCAIARFHGIPSRYVSGYLHQGHGHFGDSKMHAWAESFIPDLGWMGFDVTNNIIASEDHIKVAHGKDYLDCSPIKGVVYGHGKNETEHSVKVIAQQQQ